MEQPTEPTEQELRTYRADLNADVEKKYGDMLRRIGSKAITWREVMGLFESARKGVRDTLQPLRDLLDANVKRIAELEKTVAALQKAEEKTLADAFRGTWQPGTFYTRGGLTVWDGSLWLAMADTGEKPGSSDAWRMVTKRGKDAKS